MIKQLSENATQEEIVSNIIERMDLLGIDNSTYELNNIERITGEPWNKDSSLDMNLCLAYYSAKLAVAVVNGEYNGVPKSIKKQLKCAMGDGLICVYISTIIHAMSKIIQPEIDSNLYLGYIDDTWDLNSIPFLKIPPVRVSSFHATVTVDGKAIDACYPFQYDGVESVGELIYGDYPPTAKMWGWEMNKEASHFLNWFSSYSKSTVDELIKEHIFLFKAMVNTKFQ